MTDIKNKVALRPIKSEDDPYLGEIARYNLEKYGLDIPGTAYFDPELDHLSVYYGEKPEERFYLVAELSGEVLGGVGFAEFPLIEGCAELQKLYLKDSVKGVGLGKLLMKEIEAKAKDFGYCRIYLETHSSLETALHMYEKTGYRDRSKVDAPSTSAHNAMDRFLIKEL